MTRTELALLARTVPHLQPGQVAQRARLRAQRTALRRWPQSGRWLLAGPDPASAVGWPEQFSPLDAGIWPHWPGQAELRGGRIELLGLTRTLAMPTGPDQASRADMDQELAAWERADGERPDWDRAGRDGVGGDRPDWDRADWEQACAPQLWRFHLHYWDWAWALAAEPDRSAARALFAALWQSWHRAVVAGRGDAWLPYPTALRAWSWCGLHRDLVAGGEIEDRFAADLAAHCGFLRRHLESDVGGNHLVKNLKALIGLAAFFADDRLLEQSLDRLTDQLAVQVLPDGGHYERAPAYHCQVLADLIDVADLVRSTGRTPEPELPVAIRRMRRWLAGVLSPDGSVPLLNDGYPVSAGLLTALRPWPTRSGPLLVLPDTGLVQATAGSWQLLADVGLPCPDELPAHAHADTFSCLLHVAGTPLLVDTSTSTYEPGSRRSYERSTAAHNTVEVDDADSTEVWGAFRAARRARVRDLVTRADPGVVTIEASHDGFRRRPGHPAHRRRWSLTESGLQVADLIGGGGQHVAAVRWHFAPGAVLRPVEGGAIVTTSAGEFGVSVLATAGATLTCQAGLVATGFDRTVEAPVLTCRIDAALPIEVSTSFGRVA